MSDNNPNPILLSSVPLYSSRDPEQVEHELVRLHRIRRFDVVGDKAAFAAAAGFLQLPRATLSYSSYRAAMRIGFPETDAVRQRFVLRGDGIVQIDGVAHPIDSMHSFVAGEQIPTQVDYSGNYEQLVISIKADALAKQLQHLLGSVPKSFPRFEGAADLASPARLRFQRLVRFVADELSVEKTPLPKSLLLEYEDALVTAFLISCAGEFGEWFDRDAKEMSPWQVRAAEEFIEANWQQAVTVEVLAESIGASARSIFHAFKDARGYSPMNFLKRVRLKHARARLQRPEEGTTVTSVGFACGFHNLSHFAKDYLREFGEMPSETLKRVKGR